MREDIQDYIIEKQLLNTPLKDIVEGIENEFSVKMSKQNVSKFYSRFLQRRTKQIAEQGIVKECVEVYIRQRYLKQCFGLEPVKDVTEYKFKKYIKENSIIVDSKYNKLKDEIIKYYMEGSSVKEISEATSYKGIKTDEKVIIDIIDDNIRGTGIKKLVKDNKEDNE